MKTLETRIKALEQRLQTTATDVRSLPDARLRQLCRQGIKGLEGKPSLTPAELRDLVLCREALAPDEPNVQNMLK